MSYSYQYPRPALSVDIMIFSLEQSVPEVLLIKRLNEPFKGKWALPGGFMEMDELLHDAARRELEEETNLFVGDLKQFGIYDQVDRDPRGRCISVIFYKILDKKPVETIAGDDAEEYAWFSYADLPELAFDHSRILKDAGSLFANN